MAQPAYRSVNGTFLPGTPGGPGRPKIDEKTKAAFRDLSERALKSLGEIVDDPSHQHCERACEYVCDRRWGKVHANTPGIDDDERDDAISESEALKAGVAVVDRLLEQPEIRKHALEVLDGGKR